LLLLILVFGILLVLILLFNKFKSLLLIVNKLLLLLILHIDDRLFINILLLLREISLLLFGLIFIYSLYFFLYQINIFIIFFSVKFKFLVAFVPILLFYIFFEY